jgi:hypothetical protein
MKGYVAFLECAFTKPESSNGVERKLKSPEV